MQFILGLIVLYLGYNIYKNYQANTPESLIDNNELKAFKNKDELEKYLKKMVKDRAETLKEYTEDKKKLKDTESSKYLTEKIKDVKQCIKEDFQLMDEGIPVFEAKYIRLKEKYKFDKQKLLQSSIDYCDWYYHYKKFYDPNNFELWNESSWEDRQEAYLSIKEIEKRIDSQLK